MPDLVKKEPVLVTSAAGAAVSWVIGELVTHGVVTDTQASSATQTVVPALAGAVVLGLGVLARRFVVPVHKVADVLERDGLLTDTDFARIEAVLADKLGVDVDLDGSDDDTDSDGEVPPNQGRTDPDVTPVGDPALAGGMSAGAPQPDSGTYVAEHAAGPNA